MKLKIAVLPGDGIGPEVTAEAVKVLKVIAQMFNHTFQFQNALVGAAAMDETGDPLPTDTLDLCKESNAILFGAIGAPKYDNNPLAKIRPEQGLLKLRKELNLYANIRPVKSYDALLDKSPLKKQIIEGTDIYIYRELTGGVYFGEKHLNEDGSKASDLCEYSRFEIERITHLAFKAAQSRKNKVTLVDKANVLETSRLWRKVVKEISKEYSDVNLDFLFVDNAAMQIILNPKQFDVILTENMFGDIISDEASVIAGSIGLLASASVGIGIHPIKAIKKRNPGIFQYDGVGVSITRLKLLPENAKPTVIKVASVKVTIIIFMVLSKAEYFPISKRRITAAKTTILQVKGDQPKWNICSATPAVTIVIAACTANMVPMVTTKYVQYANFPCFL